MLNHLIATIIICLGVANTTPISNCNENHVLTATKKNATITTDYELEINPSSSQNTQQQNVATGTFIQGDTEYSTAIRYNKIIKATGGNSYLNVKAEYMATAIYKSTEDIVETSDKIWIIQGLENTDLTNTTRLGYLYKITPYNYNTDTEIQIKAQLTIESFIDDQYLGSNTTIYLQKKVYTTTENLDYLLTETPQINQVYETEKEITNVNNGFYYTEETENTAISLQMPIHSQINDITTVNIIPKVNNYIFIEYVPYTTKYSLYTSSTALPYRGDVFINSNIKTYIRGTNIIPDGTYEVVNIPGLMFEILGMPFAFVSQAFNLTLFPGTPYQINIANLFLSIIAIFVFVWLLLLFIKMKAK